MNYSYMNTMIRCYLWSWMTSSQKKTQEIKKYHSSCNSESSAMNDGWDDDIDDLSGLNDGWGDVDEVLDGLSLQSAANDECSVDPDMYQPLTAVAVESTRASTASVTTALTVAVNASKRDSNATANSVISSWDEGERVALNDDAYPSRTDFNSPPAIEVTAESDTLDVDGWDDDDDLDLDLEPYSGEEPLTAPSKPKPATLPPAKDQELSTHQLAIYKKLLSYIQGLPHLVKSLNVVLEAEYNTSDHAMELLEYYRARPQLLAYTVDVEVPRMDYQITTAQGIIITNKQDVRNYLLSQPNSILIRAANQSLLADIITVMTGELIVPKFLATAVCTFCKFKMDAFSVQVDCCMSLSLPDQDGRRMHVAEIFVDVILDPDQEVVVYQIKDIKLAITDTTILKGTAIFLSEMDDDCMEQQQPSSADAVRDNFLKQLSKTQQMAQQTSTGLSSALRQIDKVANVSTKVNALTKFMPTLPSTADIMDAHELHTKTSSQEQPLNRYSVEPSSRPKPILGGFLMSGLSRLANTIVPEDITNQEKAPPLYRTEHILKRQTPPAPYEQTDSVPFVNSHDQMPDFYQQTEPVHPEAMHQQAYPININNGWDDDEEELNFDDEPNDPVFDTSESMTSQFVSHNYGVDGFEAKPIALPRADHPAPPSNSCHNEILPNILQLPHVPQISSLSANEDEIKDGFPAQQPLQLPVKYAEFQHAPSDPEEDLVPPIPHQEYPPTPIPLLDYNPDDDIIPTRVRWLRPQ